VSIGQLGQPGQFAQAAPKGQARLEACPFGHGATRAIIPIGCTIPIGAAKARGKRMGQTPPKQEATV